MTINREEPHLLVMPEDDEWRQVVNGFLQGASVNRNSLQVLDLARGWSKAFDSITDTYAVRMRKYPKCRIVLLIDFDNDTDRFEKNRNRIPADLSDRVFVLGVLSKKPKDLSNKLGVSLEKLGEEFAKNCTDNISELWDHALLRHNKPELERIIPSVKPFLFI